MRTFLAGFCAPGSPLAKALGISHEKQPLLGDQRSPLGISKSYLSKNLKLGDANISGGFLRSWKSSGKSLRDFPMKNSPSLGTNDSPWEFQKVISLKILSLEIRTFLAGFCAPGSPLAKALGIFHEKQPLPGDQRSPLGISKSYLSKNLKLGDANISGGFLRSW